MNSEQETQEEPTTTVGIALAKTLGIVFAVGLGTGLVAALSISGIAFLIYLTGIGLSIDTRFIMATLIVCTFVLSVIAILGFMFTNASLAPGPNTAEEEPDDDGRFDDDEPSAETIAKYFMARYMSRAIHEDLDIVALPENPDVQRDRPPTHSRKPKRHRRTRK